MATPKGGKGDSAAPIPTGVVARASAAVQSWATGWFGPGVPLPPVAPKGQGVGRKLDYSVTANLNYQPRAGAAISFRALRSFAEPAEGGLDLLRMAIETRKDQMAAQKWNIRGKGKDDDGGPRARELEALLLDSPDGENGYAEWSRMLIEDHLVLDGIVLFPRESAGRILLEAIDPATIKIYIDEQGRRPLPPLPAFSQVLHGVPAHDYTAEEILYFMYNPRTSRIYGCSRVEQVVNIVGLALRRFLHVSQYYTEGNVPEALIGVPDDWNPEQIEQFQGWFDSILAGNTGERRHAKFIPGGTTAVFTKEDALKNEFDEWLARIICYCFSLSPETLVKQTNRATAETAKEAANEEGLEPLKLWFKALMNRILRSVFKETDLEFVWFDEEISDPKTKADVTRILVGAKPVIDQNEARKLWGFDPLTTEQIEDMKPAPMPSPFGGAAAGDVPPGGAKKDPTEGDDEPKPPADDAGSVGKVAGGRALHPAPRDEDAFAAAETRLRRAAEKVLKKIRVAAVAAVKAQADKVAKLSDDEINTILNALPADAWTDALREFLGALEGLAAERAAQAFRDMVEYLPASPEDIDALLSQVNEHAVAWAQERAAELVTRVDEATRDGIRDTIQAGIDEGLTNDEIADTLAESFAFSDGRSMTIARTETAFAENNGTLIGWRATGVVEKKVWLVADSDVCPECEAMDGEEVGLDEPFSDGSDGPPLHPNCRCTMTAVVSHDAGDLNDGGDGEPTA